MESHEDPLLYTHPSIRLLRHGMALISDVSHAANLASLGPPARHVLRLDTPFGVHVENAVAWVAVVAAAVPPSCCPSHPAPDIVVADAVADRDVRGIPQHGVPLGPLGAGAGFVGMKARP